jgi:hypothetical protein
MSPEAKMATAVVAQAIKDLHRKSVVQIKDHVNAVCWLGSKASIKWFEAANVDQGFALPKLRWDVYATKILLDNDILLSGDQHRLLVSTLKHFQRWHKENDDA